ncbi:hypothetical protein HZH66_007870 [Vespula vulgaris]|uniref:Uncharacterized protein n=1 Tax=Vespula vulgaris TaxID=7454 RepID=A0A834K007_VESVU|nr:hypothetical protein HZH66_007870 [Vespula vulgaris]
MSVGKKGLRISKLEPSIGSYQLSSFRPSPFRGPLRETPITKPCRTMKHDGSKFAVGDRRATLTARSLGLHGVPVCYTASSISPNGPDSHARTNTPGFPVKDDADDGDVDHLDDGYCESVTSISGRNTNGNDPVQ